MTQYIVSNYFHSMWFLSNELLTTKKVKRQNTLKFCNTNLSITSALMSVVVVNQAAIAKDWPMYVLILSYKLKMMIECLQGSSNYKEGA
jgi:hypothetical protein